MGGQQPKGFYTCKFNPKNLDFAEGYQALFIGGVFCLFYFFFGNHENAKHIVSGDNSMTQVHRFP